MPPKHNNSSHAHTAATAAATAHDKHHHQHPSSSGSSSNNSSHHQHHNNNKTSSNHCRKKSPPPLAQQQQQQQVDQDACLHCFNKTATENIQVRCDECCSYICNTCHWCHEFQANHEIRVCDRCDAFYCRACDEMDQCDDCGEVVCAACSTLLSCKFCGGGLCEDCATACGRCGIVLCSRDAKFAVDCDTCRLSYCLVCLASGNKDPCVRCNHRPSKRMEQLVHLRLKSIYKAFKQTSSASTASASSGGAGATPAAVRSLKNNELFANDDDDNHDGPAQDTEALMMAAAAASALNPPMQTVEEPTSNGGSSSSSKRQRIQEGFVFKKEEDFEKKKKRADDAAAALLAELEEEEQAEKSKKSKKKKKKERQQAKKGEDKTHEDDTVPARANQTRKETPDTATETTKSPARSRGMNESIFEETQPNGSSNSETKDPLKDEFEQLAEEEDIEGLEELLASVKGVPGKAVLRKNIKKAIKRLRSPPEQADATDSGFIPVQERVTPPAGEGRTDLETPDPIEDDARVAELLKIVSFTHNKTPTAGNRTKIPNPKGNSECIMQMAPMIVGWVIGKGGQRIRDLMEDSGARIWIDQDSMKPQDPRVVYVSGSRKNVDSAVRMIKDLIARAPGETPKSHQSTPAAESSQAKAFVTATTGKGPGVPKDFASGGDAFQLKPREGSTFGTPKTKHEMTCDPRFVPLLIGRRGWTIKNIQDASGARIDIDQTVIPRKITISGSETSVEIAKGMVGDVLSYPQSQLHGLGEDEDRTQLPKPAVENHQPFNPPAAPVAMPDKVEPPPQARETVKSPPPPTSEVLAGDFKDVVSASSSLSSTPEPTVAVKGAVATGTVQTEGLIPPPGNAVSSFPPSSGLVSDNPFARQTTIAAITPQESSTTAFPPALPQPATTNSGFSPFVGGPGPMYHPPPPQSGFDGQAFGAPNPFPHGHPPSYGKSAFHAARQGPTVVGAPPMLDRPVGNQPIPEANNVLPGIWNQSSTGPPVGPAHRQGEFGLAAAVEFLQHNQPHQRVDIPRSGLGLPPPPNPSSVVFPSPGTGLAPQNVPDPGGVFSKNESNIVDSLFGPAVAKNDNEAGLITGLDGLQLGPSPKVSSIWGNGVAENDKLNGLPGLEGLLSDSQPSAGFAENDHSRFTWGSST